MTEHLRAAVIRSLPWAERRRHARPRFPTRLRLHSAPARGPMPRLAHISYTPSLYANPTTLGSCLNKVTYIIHQNYYVLRAINVQKISPECYWLASRSSPVEQWLLCFLCVSVLVSHRRPRILASARKGESSKRRSRGHGSAQG